MELGALLRKGGQKGTGCVLGCQAQCWGAEQEASPTSQRAEPLLLWWAHSGRGLPCPPLQRLCRISRFCCSSLPGTPPCWAAADKGPRRLRGARQGRMQHSRGPSSSTSPIQPCLSHRGIPPTEAGGRMGVTSLGFSYPGDGEGHAEILPSLQPEAPGCRPIQHHLVGLHVAHLCKGRGCDLGVRVGGNNARTVGKERARCLAGQDRRQVTFPAVTPP